MADRRAFLKSTSLLLAAAGTTGYSITMAKNKSIFIQGKSTKNMLQHTVYFWLKSEVSKKEKKNFETGLKELVSNVKEIKKAEIGFPAETPDRDVVDHSFGYSLFVWFKSMEDHNIYQEHPAHEKFINEFSNLWSKVQVYDSELI